MAVKNSCPLCPMDFYRARWVDLAAMLGDEAPCEACTDKIEARSVKEAIEYADRVAPEKVTTKLARLFDDKVMNQISGDSKFLKFAMEYKKARGGR